MFSQRAVTSAEMLLVLLLVSPLLAVLADVARHSVNQALRFQSYYIGQQAELRQIQELSRTMANLDGHRFWITPKIHVQGQIAYTDGSKNSVSANSGPLSPDPDSDAITGVKLDLARAQVVTGVTPSGVENTFQVCNRYDLGPSESGVHSYLGIAEDNFFELVGNIGPQSGGGTCHLLHLTAKKSMSFSSSELTLAGLTRIIIPIIEHYTLYVDRSGQLRYLGHAADRNIENQPLAAQARQMHLNLIAGLSPNFLLLHAQLQISDSKINHYWFGHQFGRQAPLNFEINRP